MPASTFQAAAAARPATAPGMKPRNHDRGDDDVTDYRKMMRIVVDAGYRGYVGIEYEGSVLEELPGIRKTEQLLRRVHREMQGS